MGYQKKVNKAIKEETQKKVEEFIKKIKEVSDEFNFQLVPVIDKYGPKWEVQKINQKENDRNIQNN